MDPLEDDPARQGREVSSWILCFDICFVLIAVVTAFTYLIITV